MARLPYKFLKPTNDLAFKKVFGSEDHKDLLIAFLNSVLKLEGDREIESLDFLNPIQAPRLFGLKHSIVDILCKDKRNIRYIIEMQVSHTPKFEKRALYYASKAYAGQLEQSGQYPSLNRVVFLAIADHILFEDKADYRSDHLILDRKTFEHDLQDFSFTFIELPKFTKTEAELVSIEDKWIYFLKHADKDYDIPAIFKGTAIEQAYQTLERFNWSESELLAYEDASLAIVDEENRLDSAHSKGKAEGKLEGKAEGIEQRNLEIAKTLKAQGVEIAVIIAATGLDEETIVQL